MAGRTYQSLRALLIVSLAAGVLLVVLIPWPRVRGRPRSAPPRPVLETDVTDANETRLDPAGTAAPLPLSLPAPPQSTSRCPDTMVYVAADYCPGLSHICKHYTDEKMDRCREFFPTSRCIGPSYAKHFCIDVYEYPNRPGEKPLLAVNWDEAVALCSREGKRLCTAIEWSLACEGHGRLPYPYGYTRDKTACNIDKPYRFPDNSAFANPATRAKEIARLDQREPSGSRSGCVSPFGVFDMTGNVDEWVLLESGSHDKPPYKSGLKGGYWGPVRNRCRPITATHNRWHSGYQIGLRCCQDSGADDPPK